MCELLGMSANAPTDICFSFTGLMQRGGLIGPHCDGWGVAFYEGSGVRCFHDPQPCHSSALARLVASSAIKSKNVICHIRQANVGRVGMSNTHPFVRELWGQYWTFAHNGQLAGFQCTSGPYLPVGGTDSEAMFCDLLNRLSATYKRPPGTDVLVSFIADCCAEYARHGVCNLLLGNGDWLFSLCTSKLASVTRRAPFGIASLRDMDLSIDLREHTSPQDVVTVLATEPLTRNERWQLHVPGEWNLWRAGEVVDNGNLFYQPRVEWLFRLAV